MKDKSFGLHFVVKVISIICLILLVINIFRNFGTSEPLSFEGFLNTLTTAPQIKVSTTSIGLLSKWDIFDVLRRFINTMLSVLNVAIFLSGNLLNLISYINTFALKVLGL